MDTAVDVLVALYLVVVVASIGVWVIMRWTHGEHVRPSLAYERAEALLRDVLTDTEYRQVGTSILMENDKGQTRSFLVTQLDDEKLTVDGNNPLCGREVVFTLEVITVRDPTDEEVKAGGAIGAQANIDPSLMRPV